MPPMGISRPLCAIIFVTFVFASDSHARIVDIGGTHSSSEIAAVCNAVRGKFSVTPHGYYRSLWRQGRSMHCFLQKRWQVLRSGSSPLNASRSTRRRRRHDTASIAD